jgi:hypothetical protein
MSATTVSRERRGHDERERRQRDRADPLMFQLHNNLRIPDMAPNPQRHQVYSNTSANRNTNFIPVFSRSSCREPSSVTWLGRLMGVVVN